MDTSVRPLRAIGSMSSFRRGGKGEDAPTTPNLSRQMTSQSMSKHRLTPRGKGGEEARKALLSASLLEHKMGKGGGVCMRQKHKSSGESRVRAMVRVRPFLQKEKTDAAKRKHLLLPVVQVVDSHTVVAGNGTQKYIFDVAFGDTESQAAVFEEAGRPTVAHALNGYNASIFAYGQTNSGKTYTMIGKDLTGSAAAGTPRRKGSLEETHPPARSCSMRSLKRRDSGGSASACNTSITATPPQNGQLMSPQSAPSAAPCDEGKGIMQRVVEDLFCSIEGKTRGGASLKVDVSISFMEIYMETVRDLLAVDNTDALNPKAKDNHDPRDLKVRTHPTSGPFVEGLSMVPVTSAAQALKYLRKGGKERTSAATIHNERSSRSHAVFQINILQQELLPDDLADQAGGGGSTTVLSRICLIDLAGSERHGTTTSSTSTGASAHDSLPLTHATLHSQQNLISSNAGGGSASHPAAAWNDGQKSDEESTFCTPPPLRHTESFRSTMGVAHDAHHKGAVQSTSAGANGITNTLEMSSINLSLATLRRVIDTLLENAKRKTKHLPPYRESKLTWLLSECLGGNSRTVMIGTISPHLDNADETLSTLRYTLKAKGIVNNVFRGEDKRLALIKTLKAEVSDLKKQILSGALSEGGVMSPLGGSNPYLYECPRCAKGVSEAGCVETGVQCDSTTSGAAGCVGLCLSLAEDEESCIRQKGEILDIIALALHIFRSPYHTSVVFEKDRFQYDESRGVDRAPSGLITPSSSFISSPRPVKSVTHVTVDIKKDCLSEQSLDLLSHLRKDPSAREALEEKLNGLLKAKGLSAFSLQIKENAVAPFASLGERGGEGGVGGAGYIILSPTHLQARHNVLRRQQTAMLGQQSSLRAELSQLQQMEASQGQVVSQLSQEIQELCASLRKKNEACFTLQSTVDTQAVEIRLLKRKNELLTDDIEELQESSRRFQQDHGSRDVWGYKQRLVSLTQMLSDKNDTVSELLQENDALRRGVPSRLPAAPHAASGGVPSSPLDASCDGGVDGLSTSSSGCDTIVPSLATTKQMDALKGEHSKMMGMLAEERRCALDAKASRQHVQNQYDRLVGALEDKGFMVLGRNAEVTAEERCKSSRLQLVRRPKAFAAFGPLRVTVPESEDGTSPRGLSEGERGVSRGRQATPQGVSERSGSRPSPQTARRPHAKVQPAPFCGGGGAGRARPMGNTLFSKSVAVPRITEERGRPAQPRGYPRPWKQEATVKMVGGPRFLSPGSKYLPTVAQDKRSMFYSHPAKSRRTATLPPQFK